MLLLKNGYLIDPASETEGYRDILINTENGKIEQILPQGTVPSANDMEEIDLSGQIMAPGLVDVHVHFRDPGLT